MTQPEETKAEIARRRLAALTAMFDGADSTDGEAAAPTPAQETDAPPIVEPKAVTNRHVYVVAAVLCAAAILTAWWLLSGRPDKVEAQPLSINSATEPAPTAHPPTSGASPPTSSQTSAMVVVDVAGKVKDPGIVTLPAGSRVIDAVKAAGGVTAKTNTAALNLARVLSDGEQILVGIEPVASAASPNAPGGARKVNLNTATTAQLEELPGVGPVTAAAILAWRDEHGRFIRIEELLEVKGIGPATMADLEPLVRI